MVTAGPFRQYRGLHADTKPNAWANEYNENGTLKVIANVGNGDEFLEIDTGDTYYADADSNTWIKP